MSWKKWVALLALLVTSVTGSHAQAPMGESPFLGWRYYVAAYLPIVQLEGEATMSLPTGAPGTVPLGLGFQDVGENYDWAVAGLFMAKRGDWSFNVDLSFSQTREILTFV